MPSEYTPPDHRVQQAFGEWYAAEVNGPSWLHDADEGRRAFDRWLAQVKAEAAAQALEEAAAEIGAMDFGASWPSSAHRWGAKQAAQRLNARAATYRKETIRVDFNRRGMHGHLISATRRASGPIEIGQVVEVYQPGEEDMTTTAIVMTIDESGRVELREQMDPGFEHHEPHCHLQHGLGGQCTCR